jgi:hypothetical protein
MLRTFRVLVAMRGQWMGAPDGGVPTMNDIADPDMDAWCVLDIEVVRRTRRRRRADVLSHVLARIVGLLLAPLAHQLVELAVAACGERDAHAGEEIATAAFGRQSLALDAEGAA